MVVKDLYLTSVLHTRRVCNMLILLISWDWYLVKKKKSINKLGLVSCKKKKSHISLLSEILSKILAEFENLTPHIVRKTSGWFLGVRQLP